MTIQNSYNSLNRNKTTETKQQETKHETNELKHTSKKTKTRPRKKWKEISSNYARNSQANGDQPRKNKGPDKKT